MLLPLIGLFGGTFDPIHDGHLQIVTQLLKQLPFQTIQLIPTGQHPPHRPPPMTATQDRIHMIALAIDHHPKLSLNTIETDSTHTTYSIDTIKEIRKHFPDHALSFILSTDNLASFHHWKSWQAILKHVHLIVVPRQNYMLPKQIWLHTFINQHRATQPHELTMRPAGKIWLADHIDPPPYSSTQIRTYIKTHRISCIKKALPDVVAQYIIQKKLYV